MDLNDYAAAAHAANAKWWHDQAGNRTRPDHTHEARAAAHGKKF
jgi:hypothetical protein